MGHQMVLISFKNTEDGNYGYNAFKNTYTYNTCKNLTTSDEDFEKNIEDSYAKYEQTVSTGLKAYKHIMEKFSKFNNKDTETEKFLDINVAVDATMEEYWDEYTDSFEDCTSTIKADYNNECKNLESAIKINDDKYLIYHIPNAIIEEDKDAENIAYIDRPDRPQYVYNSNGKTIVADADKKSFQYIKDDDHYIKSISVTPTDDKAEFIKESFDKFYTLDDYATIFRGCYITDDGRYGYDYNSKGIYDSFSFIDNNDIITAKKDGDYTLAAMECNKEPEDTDYKKCCIARMKDVMITNDLMDLKYYITSNNELLSTYDDFIDQVEEDDIIAAVNIHY